MKKPKDGKETIERKAHARASGRGKLYHADIMDKWQAARAAEVADAVKNGRPPSMPLRPQMALRMARRAIKLSAELAAEREAHAQTAAEAAEDIKACIAARDEAQAHAYRLEQQKRRAQGGRKKSAAREIAHCLRGVLFEMWEEYRKQCRGKVNPTCKGFLDEVGETPVIVGNKVYGSVIDYLQTPGDVRSLLKLQRQNLRNAERREIAQKPKAGKK